MTENLTLYVGDKSTSFHALVRQINSSAVDAIDIYFNDSHTKSVAYLHTVDLPPKELCKMLLRSKEVIYVQPAKWSSAELEYHTIGWMEYLSTQREVKMLKFGEYGRGNINYESLSFNKPAFLNPVQARVSDDRQIWVIGCSFTHGHGLIDINKRFGQLFADNLKLPVSFLTMTGASNQWAADQILKSDIRTGDIVIWGVTGIARSTIYTNERAWPISINILDKSKEPIYRSLFVDTKKIAQMRRMISEEFLLSDHSFYESINHIEQVNNYLDKLNVDYLIGYFADLDFPYYDHMGRMMHYILDKNDPRLFIIQPEYPWADITSQSSNDINDEDDTTVDHQMVRGTHHPGPMQHEIYANNLLLKYKTLYK